MEIGKLNYSIISIKFTFNLFLENVAKLETELDFKYSIFHRHGCITICYTCDVDAFLLVVREWGDEENTFTMFVNKSRVNERLEEVDERNLADENCEMERGGHFYSRKFVTKCLKW